CHERVGVGIFNYLGGIRIGGSCRLLRGSGVSFPHLGPQALDAVFIEYFAPEDLRLESDDGIHQFPTCLLVPSPVFVSRVAEGVTVIPVGIDIKEIGTLPLAATLG